MCEYADEWRYPPGVDRLPNRWSRIYEQINFERMTRGLMYHSKGWVDNPRRGDDLKRLRCVTKMD